MAIDSGTLDILKEIGNIGSGNAASALAAMLNDKVDIGLPSCEMLPFSEITRNYESPEQLLVGTLVQMSGDMDGFVMMVMTLDAAAELLGQLTDESYDDLPQREHEVIVEALTPIQEIGNILVGSYLSAISAMTGMSLIPSVPAMSVDMAMALMNIPAVVYGSVGDKVMYMETEFHNGVSTVTGEYYLIPTVESYEKLMSALGL